MRGIAFYTGLRVALLLAAWLLVQVLTPLRGLLALAVALVISGVISFVVLDRPRDQASAGLAGVFRRIDERIERSKTAEDVDDEPGVSGKREPEAEQQAVGQGEQPGGLEDGHESAAVGTTDHRDDGAESQDGGDDPEPREGKSEASG